MSAETHLRSMVSGRLSVRGGSFPSSSLDRFAIRHADLFAVDACASSMVGATFEGVDFGTANLERVSALGARFLNCNLRGVRFADADLRQARFEGCDLRDAGFRGSDLSGARIVASTLANVDFSNASLRHAGISASVVLEVDMHHADLLHLVISDSHVRAIQLTDARRFFLTRDLVAEAFRQHSDGVLERLREASLVSALPEMCWDAWRLYAEELGRRDPLILQWVLETLGRYPLSGMADAFVNGWSWERHGELRSVDAIGSETPTRSTGVVD